MSIWNAWTTFEGSPPQSALPDPVGIVTMTSRPSVEGFAAWSQYFVVERGGEAQAVAGVPESSVT